MSLLLTVAVVVALVILLILGLAVRIINSTNRVVLFRLGRVRGTRAPKFRMIIPFVDVMHR